MGKPACGVLRFSSFLVDGSKPTVAQETQQVSNPGFLDSEGQGSDVGCCV